MRRSLSLISLLAALLLPQAVAALVPNPLPVRERNALIAIYNATHGKEWRHREGWLGPPGSECDWFGVSCAGETQPGTISYVAILNLKDNRLRGTLPRRIGKLGRLFELDLSQNQLEGPIPPDLGALPNLRFFDLSINQFSGPIPKELGKLHNVAWFNLAANRLSGNLPGELANLTQVQLVGLNDNQLTGPLPAWLGGLTRIAVLGMCPNEFSGTIPPEIFRPKQLEELGLSQCHLTGRIPSEIGDASNLGTLFLQGNLLTGDIPKSITQVARLSNIQLDWNAIHTDDEEVAAFIDARTSSPLWRQTQTLPPEGPSATATGPTSIRLSWTPVNYNPGFFNARGGYTVYASASAAGPFAPVKVVQGKPTLTTEIRGLRPGTTYHFRIDTFSLPHEENPNLLHSQRTPIVTSTTPAQ